MAEHNSNSQLKMESTTTRDEDLVSRINRLALASHAWTNLARVPRWDPWRQRTYVHDGREQLLEQLVAGHPVSWAELPSSSASHWVVQLVGRIFSTIAETIAEDGVMTSWGHTPNGLGKAQKDRIQKKLSQIKEVLSGFPHVEVTVSEIKSWIEADFGRLASIWRRDGRPEVEPAELGDLPVVRQIQHALEETLDAAVEVVPSSFKLDADNKADKSKKKRLRVPENLEVIKLAKRLRDERNQGRSKIDIAREFTEQDERRAESLLREVRRFPDLLA